MNTQTSGEPALGEQHFRLARHLTIVDEGESGTFVIDDEKAWRVHHEVARAVLEQLAAQPRGATFDELQAAVVTDDDTAVALALRELRAIRSVVVRPRHQLPEQLMALADAMQGDVGPAVRTAGAHRRSDVRAIEPVPIEPAGGERTVHVIGINVEGSVLDELCATLRANGFRVVSESSGDHDPISGVGSSSPAFTVVVTRDFLSDGVIEALAAATGNAASGNAASRNAASRNAASRNAASRNAASRNTTTAIAVRLSSRGVAMTPFFTGVGPCPECVRHHLQRNVEPTVASARNLVGAVQSSLVGDPADASASHLAKIVRPLVGIAANLLVVLLARTMVDGEQPAADGPAGFDVLVWDAENFSATRHPVRRRPQCPACGDPQLIAEQQTRPLALTRRQVIAGAAYRATDPGEWLVDKQGVFDPVTGIVRDCLDLGLVGEAHVMRGSHPVAREGSGWRHAVALGRGSTAAGAKAALLGEAVERYSAAWHGDEPTVLATKDALGSDAITPERVNLFSDAQRERRWLGQEEIPERLPRDVLIEWTPVHTFPFGEQRLVPSSALFFGHHDPSPVRYATPDSNGCAAGASLEEALLYGLLELIERDSVGIWWYSRSLRPRVDDAEAEQLVERFRRSPAMTGREVWLLDLTTDIGIPVVAALSRRTDAVAVGGTEEIVFGFGAHLNLGRAVARALGEVGQMLAIGPQARRPEHRISHPVAERFWAEARLAELPYLAPTPQAVAARVHTRPSGDLLDDVLDVTRRLATAGLEVSTIDLSRPDTGVSVVRAIVPGLRHFWPRLAPGRLYDVPLALGWRETPLTEGECNLLPLFV